MHRLPLPFLLVSLAAFGLAGCEIIPAAKPDPTQFYVLSVPAIPTTREAVPPGAQIRLGLRPLTLPGYLSNTKNLVVRRGTNAVTYLTFDRWAENLDLGAGRLIAQRLAASARVSGVETYPFDRAIDRDYDLSIDIERCEGQIDTAGNAIALVVLHYEITTAGAGGKIVAQGTLAPAGQAWDGRDANALAAALSQTLLHAADGLVAELPAKLKQRFTPEDS